MHDVCCWGGTKPGLLTNVWDAFYGPEQRGQWSYSTANGAVLIVQAWINPFLRVDNGCGSAEPHDYAGLWNPGDQWAPFLRDEAKKKQGAVTLAGWGQAAVIGMGTGAPGVWLACDRNLYAGGVALWLDDTWGPEITSAGVPSGSWFGDKAPTNISVSSGDEGLGVQYVKLLNEGKGVIAEEKVNNCTGLYGSACPTTHTSPFSGVTGKHKITGDSFGEGIRESSVTVSDPTGKTAEKFFTTKVDNSKPEVALSGQLAEATGEVVSYTEGENPVGDGKDKLRLPVYNLKIGAKDGALTDDKTKRSGVKDIEVWLGDKELKVDWEPLSSCPATSCARTVTYPLDLTEIDTAGSHKLKVIAKDFVGEEKEREIEFEYFPATGMKDEYVMHHFPLPDGQGNEAEEEHPVRPELAVNVMNGNLVYRERDIDVDGTAGVDLEVERFYNSQLPDSENTEWGDGWTLAQTPDLEPVDTGGSPDPDEAELIDRSGAVEDEVELPTETGAEKFDPALQATLTKRSSGGFELTDETGESATSVVFDEAGQTEARLTEGSAKVDYRYEGGELAEIEVTDPATFAADPEDLQIPEPPPFSEPDFAYAFGLFGDEAGEFESPADVAVGPEGDIWVVDAENERIQHFSRFGLYLGEFGTEGYGDGQLRHPVAIEIDPDSHLWVLDSYNDRVQKFNQQGEFLTKWGTYGKAAGQLDTPEGMAIDAEGNFWIADTFNDRLQKFSPTGALLKVTGTSGPGDLSEPLGLDVGPGGEVFVADKADNRIVAFDKEGTYLRHFGSVGYGEGQFHGPLAVEVDTRGGVWVLDGSDEQLEHFEADGDFVAQFGSEGTDQGEFEFERPAGITTDARGGIWIVDSGNYRLQRWTRGAYRPSYEATVGSFGTANGKFDLPGDIDVDSEGDVWVIDTANNRVQQLDSEGKFISKFGTLGSANGQLKRPSAIEIDAEDKIWVADAGNDRLQKFNQAGQYLAMLGSSGTTQGKLDSPEGIAIDQSGDIWVSDTWNDRVQRFSSAGAFEKALGTSGEGKLNEPMGLGVLYGEVFVADEQNHRIAVFDQEGAYLREFGAFGYGLGQFRFPNALEIDDSGNVWVGDEGNERILQFNPEGEFVTDFGGEGTGEGEFELTSPSGVATDAEGGIWVTDSANDRLQRWERPDYVPAPEPELTDGDAEVEVETPGGLVSSVAGNAAGEHDYAHEGELLVSHDGPDGETDYDYDGEDRLTKVTLPNGTWAEIDYEADYGRVEEVRISIEGGAVKATEFEYEDEPRRTKVIPQGAPHLVYDIGDDGSVLKWWNVKKPPELDVSGALYDNREIDGFFWEGARVLEVDAESVEGLASIQIIANGDTLVDEHLCPKPKVIECTGNEESEWVTESDLHAPGHLQLEVIATDRNEESTSERFWVDVPKPTPLAPGTPVQPRFRDIARFREEFGLEVVFPVANETELNERILDLIKAWNEPNTPAGQVARASMDRWGVPLRPADVAEMEYRDWYVEVNGALIEPWSETHHAGSYAGYFVDHRAGGIMRVGFTSSQGDRLGELQSQLPLVATDRLASYPKTPSHSLQDLEQAEHALSAAIEENTMLASSVTEFSVEHDANTLRVGTDNVSLTESMLAEVLGTQPPATVFYEPDKAELISGRFRTTGRMRAGDGIYNVNRGPCTAGFGAYEDRLDPKSNGETIRARFLLGAGHCYMLDEHVDRPSSVTGGKPWSDVGQVTRNAYLESHPLYPTDALAIRLKTDGIAPRAIYGSSGNAVSVEKPAIAGIGTTLCYSGAKSGRVSRGPVSAVTSTPVASLLPFGPPGKWIKGYRVKFNELPTYGDSGSPVWNCRSGASVGLAVAIFPKNGYAAVAPLLPHPKLVTPGILNVPSMYDIQIITGD